MAGCASTSWRPRPPGPEPSEWRARTSWAVSATPARRPAAKAAPRAGTAFASAARSPARPGAAPPRRPRPAAHPELGFPDEAPDRRYGSPRRPEVRRLPRHAAPPASFGRKVTGFRSRMTGLLVPRALVGGAHS
jgi:hypothetical protein